MDTQLFKGRISFINHEKFFATIEYKQNNKHKSVNCKTNATDSDRKPNQYRLGDEVSFSLKLSDRGDKMTAYNVRLLYNPAIDLLIQKAAIENRFSGYLKKVEDQYFVKEWDSYILFTLQLSPWEKAPAATAENEPVAFRLINLDKPKSLAAELFSHNYIPEYRKAVQHFQNGISIEAVVARVSPHAIYLNLFTDQLQAKLPVKDGKQLKEGDKVAVKITHLTNKRIIVAKTEV